MSRFKCQGCGCSENILMGNFHEAVRKNERALCSECDPKTNMWHGRFPKLQMTVSYNREFHGPMPVQYQWVVPKQSKRRRRRK